MNGRSFFMAYISTALIQDLVVDKVISIHYFEYMSDFSFGGEAHDFWEFLCVDKGEVGITAGDEHLILHTGDIIFHKPNEFHALAANGVNAPNLVVISFECHSPSMEFYKNKVFTIGDSERNLIAQIILEARSNFLGDLDDPYLQQLVRCDIRPFGAEQLIKIHLEHMLIQLYRRFSPFSNIISPQYTKEVQNDLYNGIIAYFENNIRSPLTIEKICKDNLIGASHLKKMFRERFDCGVIEYFNKMKMDAAKQLIRNRKMNFTQIADYLGFASVHYFSRYFKIITHMTPTEYLHSIKQRFDQPNLAEKERRKYI